MPTDPTSTSKTPERREDEWACSYPGCGLPPRLHGAPPDEPPNPTPAPLDGREALPGHTPPPPPGGDISIVYKASEVIALGNRRYDEGFAAGLAALPDSGERRLDDDLRAAIEIMDSKVTPYGEREDGTTAAYIVGDATWHRVLSVARGHVSDAARAAIDQWRANGGDPDRDASVALDAALSALATPTRDAQPAEERPYAIPEMEVDDDEGD